MKNELIINGADLKFSDFLEKVDLIPREFHGDSWYIKMRELDIALHNVGMQDKVTFTDERLILIAYKIMTETGMFDGIAKANEWWIVYRYIQLYAQNMESIDVLSKFINMYMGFAFSKAVMDEKANAEFEALSTEVSALVYEDGPLQPLTLPNFVNEVINAGVFVEPAEEEEEEEEFDFSDARAKFENLKETSEMMLRMELEDVEREKWQGALDTAEMMLRNLEQ